MRATPPRPFTPTRRDVVGGVLAGGAALAFGGLARAAAPQRVVSLNPCLDTILVHVADRSQIAALSHYARERASSTIADIAETLPFTHETAEEVIALDPDLVVTSRHSALATQQALTRLGIPFELFDVPEAVEASLAQVETMARLIGRPAVGDGLTASIRADLDAAAPPPDWVPIEAIVFQARGLAAGRGTLVDEMLTRLGFVNVAARYGIRKWGNVQLEQLIADPPQLLLSGAVMPGAPVWAERILSHPALAAIRHQMKRAPFAEASLYCGGPVLKQTIAALVDARTRYRQGAL